MRKDELLAVGGDQARVRETDGSVLPLMGVAVLLVGHVSVSGLQVDAPSISLRFCADRVRRVVHHNGGSCGRGRLFLESLTRSAHTRRESEKEKI